MRPGTGREAGLDHEKERNPGVHCAIFPGFRYAASGLGFLVDIRELQSDTPPGRMNSTLQFSSIRAEFIRPTILPPEGMRLV